MSPAVGPMAAADWNDVARIYEEGLATGDASFETSAPTWKSWDEYHLLEGRLVARDAHEILGWAALSPVSDRCVYGGVAEVCIYDNRRGSPAGVSAERSWRRSSRPPKRQASGRCRPAFSPRTPPASRYTTPAVSVR